MSPRELIRPIEIQEWILILIAVVLILALSPPRGRD
jgi:hypothetical protein